MKYYEKNKESSYLQYWDDWATSRKLPVNNSE